MLWWLSPTSAAARTTSPLSSSASPDLGRSKEYHSCGKLDSPEGTTNTKMSARTRLEGRRAEGGALRPRVPSVAKALSGCFSNQHRRHPLRVEVADAKRQICQALGW